MDQTIVAVIVAYNPDTPALRRLLSALLPQVDRALVVDNGSDNAESVRASVAEFGAEWMGLPENLGIAAAQNRGIEWAMGVGASHLLLSDQDSVPAADMVERLMDCLWGARVDEVAVGRGGAPGVPDTSAPIAAVGPVPLDGRGTSEEESLVYSFTTWGPKRRMVPRAGQNLSVPFVLASGCLIPVEALRRVGPMDEALFIDHVDLAWCLRAIRDGFQVVVAGDARLYHSLGDQVAHVPGRAKPVHLHSPIRNYYMMRNTLFLMRAPFMPWQWKAGYVWWMAKYIGYYLLATPDRGRRLPLLVRAIRDGLAGRGGRLS